MIQLNNMTHQNRSLLFTKFESAIPNWLLTLWIVSSIIETLFYFPVIQYKLQIFEVIFLITFIIYFKSVIKVIKNPFPLKMPLAIFLLLIAINLIAFFDRNTILGNISNLYTILIPIVFFTLGRNVRNFQQAIERGLLLASVLMPITCLMSYLIYYFGLSEAFVFRYIDYPYLGDIVRLKGFATTPNEVVFISSICIFYLLFKEKRIKQFYKILLITMLLNSLFFTFSKEILIIPFAILIGAILTRIKFPFLSWMITIISIVSITSITFLYFSTAEKIIEKDYVDKTEVVFEIGKIKAYPTAYFSLWRSGVRMIQEHPLLGVGYGNFSKEVDEYKLRGVYPENLPSLRPHDNYIGLIAQYGFGFTFFLTFLILSLRRILRNNILEEDKMFIATSLIFILIFGFTQLSYHSRWMWVFFGIVMLYATNKKGKIKTYQ